MDTEWLIRVTVGILVVLVTIGLMTYALTRARTDARWLWPWRAFGYACVALVVIIDMARLGFPPWQQYVGAIMGMMVLYMFSAGRHSQGDIWPRPYRWRREADRAMGRERAGRHAGSRRTEQLDHGSDDNRGIFQP